MQPGHNAVNFDLWSDSAMPGLTLHPVLPRSCASLLHPIKKQAGIEGKLGSFKVQERDSTEREREREDD